MTVKTRATIKSEANANINDNTSGDVSPQDVRDRVLDIADSYAALQEDIGKGTSVALAGTLSLGVGWLFHITAGTGPVTDIDFATPWDGRPAIIIADVAFTLTHNATTLICPGGANLSVSAGDRLTIVQDSGDNIIVVSHIKADGSLDATKLSGTTPDASLPTRLQPGSATVTDADTATSSGFYDMASGGSNVPETSAYSIIVDALDTNNLVQIAYAHASQRSWVRRRVSGTFGSWTINGGQIPSRTFSGTTDTLVAADAGGTVRSTGASAATITVPPNSSVPIAVDTFILGEQYGAGQVTIAAGVGVTLRSDTSKLKMRVQYGAISFHKIATDEWIIAGDLTT